LPRLSEPPDLSEADQAVLIDRAVLVRIRRIAERSGFRHEVGGVLLGSYRGGHLHVTDATAPQGADRWSRTRFWRSPQGHQEIAQAAWTRSGGLITHVGEWHSHPETWPSPSLIDRSSWLKSRREQSRALTFAIVGRRDVCVCAIADAGGVRRLQRIDDDGAGSLYGEAPLKLSPHWPGKS
jgi:integrative and conjugative element protein (TIGR02256 family)